MRNEETEFLMVRNLPRVDESWRNSLSRTFGEVLEFRPQRDGRDSWRFVVEFVSTVACVKAHAFYNKKDMGGHGPCTAHFLRNLSDSPPRSRSRSPRSRSRSPSLRRERDRPRSMITTERAPPRRGPPRGIEGSRSELPHYRSISRDRVVPRNKRRGRDYSSPRRRSPSDRRRSDSSPRSRRYRSPRRSPRRRRRSTSSTSTPDRKKRPRRSPTPSPPPREPTPAPPPNPVDLEGILRDIAYLSELPKPDPNAALTASGLQKGMDANFLLKMLSPFGSIESVKMATDTLPGAEAPNGVVNFYSRFSAEIAVMKLNGVMMGAADETDPPTTTLTLSLPNNASASGASDSAADPPPPPQPPASQLPM